MAEHRSAGLSLGSQALIGLVVGLAAGAAIAATAQPTLLTIGSVVEVFGTLWINAILMCILPLVVSKLIVSIAGHDEPQAVGRSGWRAAVLFIGLLTVTGALTAAVMPSVFAWLTIDPAASAALRSAASAPSSPAAAPTIAQWVISLVPTNAIRSAADGAIVPLIVFTVAFALGASRLPRERRDPLVLLCRSVDASITVLLHWIVALAPYGVFALGLSLAMHVGMSIVGALAYYILVSSGALVVFTALLYLVVWIGAGVSPGRFARAAAPVQIVAFGTHSSMASFPAMLDAAEKRLGLSQTATGFVLPLALAVFKYSGPIWFVVVTYFVGRLYGVAIDPARAVTIVVASVATSFAVGAVPSGAALVVAPVLLAAGLPVEAMGLLLAVDPIPNGFRTVANVTGMLAVAVLTDGRAGRDQGTMAP
jgi:Na+/H+-dicarboxylate symporter